ncbi:MAG TPA: sensor histidine kinase KdpD [Candidatus Saccharimonadales bacterium]|jgi:two-component system sensor histidine kinase KdpD|nr:sensor histidine kinase KdpD [Candidatus Saccharimonadales bacterium]
MPGSSMRAQFEQSEHAWLRVYIGAAPGVGKTYQMLRDGHLLRDQGVDVAIGFVETYGRTDTEAQVLDLEAVPRRQLAYRNVVLEEMDLDAVIRRKPQVCLVDELAHTNVPGSKNHRRYQDVLDLLDAGIHVLTAINIQHMETLNDAVSRSAGTKVRETVPDSFLKRADEVINVDVSVEELRTRLRQGRIYPPEKIEQALAHFFRKGNLSTLRELALRTVAEEVGSKAARYREHEGLEKSPIPERVMVCVSPRPGTERLLRTGARISGRLASDFYAVFVESTGYQPGRIAPEDHGRLTEMLKLAEDLGARVVCLKSNRVADALIDFAQREGITHVIFGQSVRTRWEILLHGSVLNRFLDEVREATVQVIPLVKKQ